VGAAATLDGGALLLRAWVGLPDGSAWISDEHDGAPAAPQELGRVLAERMLAAGAGELLRRAEEMAGVGA
jgi:hydroxymethylbilane synthase